MTEPEPGVELTRFTSQQHPGDPLEVLFEVRVDLRVAAPDEFAASLASVPWKQLHHAYGPAVEVPALLYAVTRGTDPVRRAARWELWGNVHHQGTVYEATPACVPFLAQIVGDPDHPDRVNALSFLRQIAIGDGTFAPPTRAAVELNLPPLLQSWQQQPELVQRALLLLVAVFPDRLTNYPGLVEQLPARLQTPWDELASAGGNPAMLAGDEDEVGASDEMMDRQDELERYLTSGVSADPGRCKWRCPAALSPQARAIVSTST